MNYKIISTPPFAKQLKRLAKKFPSLKKEMAALFETLATNPIHGKPLGNNCFKIRISIASKGKGKSGGARVITFVEIADTNVYLLSIYDKSELDSISDKDLDSLTKNLD